MLLLRCNGCVGTAVLDLDGLAEAPLEETDRAMYAAKTKMSWAFSSSVRLEAAVDLQARSVAGCRSLFRTCVPRAAGVLSAVRIRAIDMKATRRCSHSGTTALPSRTFDPVPFHGWFSHDGCQITFGG